MSQRSFLHKVKWFQVLLYNSHNLTSVISRSLSRNAVYVFYNPSQLGSKRLHLAVYTTWPSKTYYIYEVHTKSFQTVFVWAFEIIVDSWKFSMLLLYILWDDWSIFIISGSNEHLQQQLKYTLLKPDCHSWWISKMQSDTLEERYAIKFRFKLGKNATETYGMLQTAFWTSCMNRASVFEWHKRFKGGTESVRDDERCGRSKEVNTS